MAAIASFHLVRQAPGRLGPARALTHLGFDRRQLARTPGLRFWRLLGTARGSDTAPGAELGRTALFALWDDALDLDVFLAASPVAAGWARASEVWSVRLRGLGGHGRWRGVDVLGEVGEADPRAHVGPIAVVTRAHVRPSRWHHFQQAGRPVSDELQGAPGLLAVVGFGEAPVGRQGTFSLWADSTAAERFARSSPRHVEVVARTRDERWYAEELFARFAPFGAVGTWDGRNPLG